MKRGSFLLPIVVLYLALCCPAAAEEVEPSAYGEALEHYRAGRYDAVIELLSGREDRDAGESNLLGWTYLRTGDRMEAVAEFRRAVELKPDDLDSHCGLGFAWFQQGEFERAAASFTTGAGGSSRDVQCRIGLARSLESLGRVEEAAEAYRQVLQLDPANDSARAKLELLSSPQPEPESMKPVEYFASGDYFWKRIGHEIPSIVYVKGVNFSFGLPGRYLTEFPEKTESYLEWFRMVREMNANVVRVYTILPPPFYRALHEFNRGRPFEDRILLIQGIWSVLPEEDDFRDPEFIEQVRSEIRDAVNVVHGRADIPHRYGHAYGIYRADISNHLLAFIFGREWEPAAVTAYNGEGGPEESSYEGDFISIAGANRMEAWLAEMLDFLVRYEVDSYGVQRPVAWMNWPPLDPLHHPAEATYLEALEIRRAKGEQIAFRVPPSEIYDNDAVSVDETKLEPQPQFRAGLFSSHHIYPYYPDFLKNEKRYAEDPGGYYAAYLRHMKEKYGEMPLLVSEYGVPTSRGIARFHPEGMNHGGHTEQQQAEVLERLTGEIRETGCAGGILFEWIDEWIKKNWMVAGTERRDRIWYNAMDPEESYGLIAMRPAGDAKLDSNPEAWNDATRLYEGLQVDSDAGYLYVRLGLDEAPDWESDAYLLAIDTFGDREGDHRLPFGLDLTSPVGFEFVVLLHGGNSSILVDDLYNRSRYDPRVRRREGLSGYEDNGAFRLQDNSDGVYTELVTKHRRRFGRDGTVFPEQVYRASPLRQGRISDDSLADWNLDRENNAIELRIPWGLLHFSDPSRMEVLRSAGESVPTSGIRLLAVSYRPVSATDPQARDGGAFELVPEDPAQMVPYAWKGWDRPEYESRPKAAFHKMREVYGALEDPKSAIELPEDFTFGQLVEGLYGRMEDFLAEPGVLGGTGEPFGEALRHLVIGAASGNRFHIREALRWMRTARNSTEDPRVQEAAEAAAGYAIRLLSGAFEPAGETAGEPLPVAIERPEKAPRRFSRIVLGKTEIRLDPGSRIHTQVDRVTRDWLSGVNLATAPWNFDVERAVNWHEGARIRELLGYVDLAVVPVWGTRARRFGTKWYTPDADGIYRFEITPDKVRDYPSNIVLSDHEVILNDTHGISAIAWDSLGADLAVGCGDHPGKVEAAYYLADRGVDVYMPTDRYLGALIGTRTSGKVVGSAPIRKTENGAVIGGQPVSFSPEETIVVSTTDGAYPMQYYDTPHRYFRNLEEFTGRKLQIVSVDIPEYGKAGVVVDKAREVGAMLIGIRVSGAEEHDAVHRWLEEDRRRRAVLFHSAAYDEGYRLFSEFPEQATFGDIYPLFERR